MYLIQSIQENSRKYNDTRRDISNFLLDRREKVADYSMQTIAELTFTSKTTLFRYAQLMGFSGWKEFIQAFLKDIYQEQQREIIDPNIPFQQTDSLQEIVHNLTQLQKDSLTETSDLIDYHHLERAVDFLLKAKQHIVIFGISPNNLLGEVFRRKMATIGYLVQIAATDESGNISRAMVKGDCAILISYSGNNLEREPMKYISNLKSIGVNLIGITSGGDSILREASDCVLTISSREKLYSKIANFTTEESILHILNILYAACFSKNFHHHYLHKLKTSQSYENRRSTTLFQIREE